jgi:GNAT superfamily N-acetyltransferase
VIIRPATASDAAQLVDLIALLNHPVEAAGVADRLARLADEGIPQLVSVENDQVLGLCGLHEMTAIHRDAPVGRITILAVAPEARGRGIGRQLVESAEDFFRQRGCKIVEITSNDRLSDAHSFYEHIGYQRTSKRFARTIA